MSSRIDVSIEHRGAPEPSGKKDPNTCPKCESHYRDDELDATLWVCPHCGHHFPMKARARIASLADEGSFVEEATDVRSEDPLAFFDLRPYTERLAEAELKTGLGEAVVVGRADVEGRQCELAGVRGRVGGRGVVRGPARRAAAAAREAPRRLRVRRAELPLPPPRRDRPAAGAAGVRRAAAAPLLREWRLTMSCGCANGSRVCAM